jgi:hypothetical protein
LTLVICAIEGGTAFETTNNGSAQALFLFGVLLIFAVWIFIIFVHELGHAVTAWTLGWRVPLIAIQGLTIWLGGWRVRCGPRLIPANGFVWLVPKNRNGYRWQYGCIVVAGACANFILAVGALLLANYWNNQNFLSLCCNIVAGISVMMGLLNLVPRFSGTPNDGEMLLKTIKDASVESGVPELQAIGAIWYGTRPRDWSVELVEQLQDNVSSDCGAGSSGLLLFSRFFDERDMVSANTALDWAEKKLGSSNDGVRLCRALLLAYWNGRGAEARGLLSAIESKATKRLPEYQIAWAVTAWVLGNSAEQDAAVRHARIAMDRGPVPPCVSNLELLDELQTPRADRSKLATEIMAN